MSRISPRFSHPAASHSALSQRDAAAGDDIPVPVKDFFRYCFRVPVPSSSRSTRMKPYRLLICALEALTRSTGAHAYPRRKRDGKRQGTLGFLSARGLQIEVLRALGFVGARV